MTSRENNIFYMFMLKSPFHNYVFNFEIDDQYQPKKTYVYKILKQKLFLTKTRSFPGENKQTKDLDFDEFILNQNGIIRGNKRFSKIKEVYSPDGSKYKANI